MSMQCPEYGTSSGEAMSGDDAVFIEKVIRHRLFVHHFCQTVDPVILLPCTRIRDHHKEVVRKKNSTGSRLEANLELLDWVRKEPDWEAMLLGALQTAEFLETLWRKLHPGEAMPGQRQSAVPAPGLPDTESRLTLEFQLCGRLGRGGFGCVFEAKHRTDGRHYAVKVVGLRDDSDRKRVGREVRSLASLDHPGIIRYHTSWWEDHQHGWEKSLLSRLPGLGSEGTGGDWDSSSTEQVGSSSRAADTSTRPADKGGAKPGLGLDLFLSEDLLETDGAEFPSQAGTTFSWSASPQAHTQEAETASLVDSSHHRPSPACRDSQSRDEGIEREPGSAEDRREAGVGVRGEGDPRGPSRGRACPRPYLCIQTELCSRRTLADLLEEGDRDRGRDLGLFRQIVEAVAHIHRNHFIHRDLKPSNIFLVGEARVKVGDFGLVAEWSVEDLAGDGGPGSQAQHTARVGTALYMSPEQREGGSYNDRADIYALGMVLLELLVPFGSGAERVKVLEVARRLQFPEDLHRDLPRQCELLGRMLSERVDERPSAEEILEILGSW